MQERVEGAKGDAVAEEDAKGFIAWLGRLLARPATQRFITTLIVINGDRVVDRIVGALPPNDLKMRLFPYLMKT